MRIPIPKKEYVASDTSFALFLLYILYVCGKYARPINVPNIVVIIASIDSILLLLLINGPEVKIYNFANVSIAEAMAPKGFEPSTPGLKVQCSTRLSYGAVVQ